MKKNKLHRKSNEAIYAQAFKSGHDFVELRAEAVERDLIAPTKTAGRRKTASSYNMSLQEVAQIANKFTVFGRVTPEQKHTIIKTLKTQGNIVAMTGDGVNDTLALKEANCSIAMADGSEVARNISHLVLMESNFSALPSVVEEEIVSPSNRST